MSQKDYLNAMGISTWDLQDAGTEPSLNQPSASRAIEQDAHVTQAIQSSDASLWTFVIDQLSGDASLLFDKILASLMLTRAQVQIITSAEALAGKASGHVVLAMGSDLGKRLLQSQEPFEELRGAVHSLEHGETEWPVVLTYHPEHLLKRSVDKSKTWQDLILARSLI
jgi:DNA polymerase III psi subunit